ncbi:MULTISPECIES: restriction endonuclease subunit S [Aeromonas]|uniref:Restriction endonuclease subunit S n=1 Tax=Aeromonas veronii TaxID=654 RepID=A0AAC9B5D4_AERVE|nr:restriction endonuclease subunit S [Aeromonas veronii]ANB51848.1 hypothetical protein WM43_03795 [Aeromonas veronii]MCF5908805.1 restriction endonuclease subunit S [Aeromonas veronii]MCR4450852.1 restriction endonuclease subunit S [Aeromonas veronii]PNW67651.1 restriction endonuclease subunit S [Aeromonas veronii]
MVPNGWSAKPLADIVKEKISYGIVQAGPHVPDGIPYIKSSDVRGTINPYSLQRTSQEIHFKYRRSSVHPGDIVFSLRGNIGESAIVPASLPEANLTQGTARISVSAEHSNQFHYYQLASEKILNRINALSKGSTFKEISLEELRKVKVLCAPLPEQKKIAKILSTWDRAISNTEQLLANSQQQKKALMQQLLTGKKRLLDNNGVRFSGEWESKSLSDIAEVYQPKTISQSMLTETGYPVYGANGIIGLYEEFNHATEQIAVTCRGSTCGVVNWTQAQSWITGNAMVINTDNFPAISKKFLFYVLDGSNLSYLISGSGQPQITGNIKTHVVKIPALEEQQKIATILSTADQEIIALQQKLDALKQEKKALMQQLLTGKRRVKVEEAA